MWKSQHFKIAFFILQLRGFAKLFNFSFSFCVCWIVLDCWNVCCILLPFDHYHGRRGHAHLVVLAWQSTRDLLSVGADINNLCDGEGLELLGAKGGKRVALGATTGHGVINGADSGHGKSCKRGLGHKTVGSKSCKHLQLYRGKDGDRERREADRVVEREQKSDARGKRNSECVLAKTGCIFFTYILKYVLDSRLFPIF